jgi:hypothetical protein
LIIGESSNFLFTKGDKAGKRLANAFMHLKIINNQSVYQIIRGVEQKVLASFARYLKFAYFTFGINARDMAEMYGVEGVLQHFHHQQVLIDRRCHGGNVLTFADDMANLQNTAKMLKVVDAGNSTFREYTTVQEVWNKVHDVEFSKTDGFEMAQEAKFTNKFIREVTAEDKQKTQDKRIATEQAKSAEDKQKSQDKRQTTLQARSAEDKQNSEDKRQATLQAKSAEDKQETKDKRKATVQAKSAEDKQKSEEKRIASRKRARS